MLGNGGGTFQAEEAVSTQVAATGLATADLTGTGVADLIAGVGPAVTTFRASTWGSILKSFRFPPWRTTEITSRGLTGSHSLLVSRMQQEEIAAEPPARPPPRPTPCAILSVLEDASDAPSITACEIA